MTITITRCCGHTETIDPLPNLRVTQAWQDRMEAQMCYECEREVNQWLAERYAERLEKEATT